MDPQILPNKETKSNKILAIVFLVLVLAVTFEVVYIFFFSKNKSTPKNNVSVSTPSSSPSQTATKVTPPVLQSQASKNQSNNLQLLSNYAKDALFSSTLKNEFKGELVDIDLNGGTTGKLVYKVKLQLKSPSGVLSTYYILEKDLKRTSIFAQSSNNNITFSQLNRGDNIIIVQTLDLTQDSFNMLQDIKITKN
ncbi:MAG: hypothetical protein Q8P10_01345 [bacterium]|nr:hypothetical protein [bacterium]